MNGESLFVLTCCLIAGSLARPSVILAYQDSLGQYSFGYSAPGSARSEIRTLDGNTHGAYSYIDGSGAIQTTQYSADSQNGFRVIASNLPLAPLPVQDTPEVIAAREAHLQAVQLAEQNLDAENKDKAASEVLSRSANVESQPEAKPEGDDVKVQPEEKKEDLKEDSEAKDVPAIKEKRIQLLDDTEDSQDDASKEDHTTPAPIDPMKTEQDAVVRDAKANVVPIYTVQVLPQDPSQDTVYTLPLHRIPEITRAAVPSDVDQTSGSQESSELLTPAGTSLNNEPLAVSKIAPTEAPTTPEPEKQQEQSQNLPEPQKQQEQQFVFLENPLYYVNYVYV